jgi:glycine/D-amino acid oxidase-like deaminating enzyme
MTDLDAEVLVVGLGIHGIASVVELTRTGVSVIGIERFEQHHERGSSHGATRMIRRAYPSAVWNPFVSRAFAGWDRWAADAGAPFVTVTGGLYAATEPGRLQGPGCAAVAKGDMHGVMPSLAVPDGYFGVSDPFAGVVAASAAMDFAHDAAISNGAELRYGESLVGWSSDAAGVTVETSSRTLRVGRLVLATGPWTGTVVPQLASAFEVWRIVTLTARTGQLLALPPELGTFSVDRENGLIFGIPEVNGHGFKIGIDAGPVWDPNVPNPPATADEIAVLDDLMHSLVPGIDTSGAVATACLYTMTPDKRFVVGELPWDDRVIVAAACSGHGFKFGPAIGESVADLVANTPRPDLAMFAVERFTRAQPTH